MEGYLLFFVVFDQRIEHVKQRINDSDDDDEPAAVYEENWSGGAATPRRNQQPTPNTQHSMRGTLLRCLPRSSAAFSSVRPSELTFYERTSNIAWTNNAVPRIAKSTYTPWR